MISIYNYAIINNNYGRLQDLILLFKVPKSTPNNSSKFIDNLGTRPQESCQPWSKHFCHTVTDNISFINICLDQLKVT
jgi:hypothetical protein